MALGLDASESDPLQGLKVTGAGFHAMAGKIAALGLPTVLVQEGGYLSDDLGQNLVQFLSGFGSGPRLTHSSTETFDMARTGADLIIETLKTFGVRRIYGVSNT